jgi:uncharacterized protein (UPF0332 family)
MPASMPCQLCLSSTVYLPPNTQGVRSLFNRHYVRTGKITKELAQIYNDLFERRQEGDYMDFVDFEESQVRPWIARAEQFVEHIASIIESHRE